MRQYLDCPAKRDLWEKVKNKVRAEKCNSHSLESFFSRKEEKTPIDVNIHNSDEAKPPTGSLSSKETHANRTVFRDQDIVCFVVNPVISFC